MSHSLVLPGETGYPTLEQAYRRICFNIMAVNQDDHVKNIAFLMDEAGQWRLAPAFDITYARGSGYTRQHQMRASAASATDSLPAT